jgi:peptidoglycan hydrolase-like protein with peptidoglycan-binding domain
MSLKAIRLARYKRLQDAAANNPPLRSGETGEAVESLQQALIDLGFEMPISTRKTGFPDGIYGKETASVIMKFQARERLQQDGVAGRVTLGRLDEIFARIQARDQAQFQADILLPPPMRKFNGS